MQLCALHVRLYNTLQTLSASCHGVPARHGLRDYCIEAYPALQDNLPTSKAPSQCRISDLTDACLHEIYFGATNDLGPQSLGIVLNT